MPDFDFLAKQILAYTRVDWDPKFPKVGEKIMVQTIPGILPFIPADLTGTAIGGLPTGPLNVALNALVRAVSFKVKYKVFVNGTESSSVNIEPLSPSSLPDSDPLQALLLIAPPLIEDRKLDTPVNIEIQATITVEVEGNKAEAPFKIPIPIPPIPIPAFLVLTGGDEEGENKVFVMVRPGSSITDINGAVTTINSVVQALNSVKDVLDFGLAFDALVGSLTDAADMITGAAQIAGFAVEEAPDLDDYNDFDDEPRKSILFGPVGTAVEFFSGEDYNANIGGDDEVSTFTITEDFGAAAGVTTGFGVHRVSDWNSRMWDTDSDDNMDDCESCRFIA